MTLIELLAKISEFFQEKKNPILASIIICFVTLGMHYYSNQDKLAEKRNAAATEVMNAFEDSKNALSYDLEQVFNGKSLSSDDLRARKDKISKLVKVIMQNRAYISSKSLFDLVRYTRFDDSKCMLKLFKLSKPQIIDVQSKLVELQTRIREELTA